MELNAAEDYSACFEFEDIRNYFINKILPGFINKTLYNNGFTDTSVQLKANAMIMAIVVNSYLLIMSVVILSSSTNWHIIRRQKL